MLFFRFRCAVLALFLVALVCGCGESNPLGRKAISGTVNLDGAPVKQGSINFQPLQKGGVSSGSVIKDGKYSMPADKGLPTGKYRVTISAADSAASGLGPDGMPGSAPPAPKELIPAKYNTESKETVEVGDKRSYEFPFDLKSQ